MYCQGEDYIDSFRVCQSEAGKGQAVAVYMGVLSPPYEIKRHGRTWIKPSHTDQPHLYVYFDKDIL